MVHTLIWYNGNTIIYNSRPFLSQWIFSRNERRWLLSPIARRRSSSISYFQSHFIPEAQLLAQCWLACRSHVGRRLLFSGLWRHYAYSTTMTSHERQGIKKHRHLNRLFNSLFMMANKENIKALHYWPFVGEIHRHRWFPHKTAGNAERVSML